MVQPGERRFYSISSFLIAISTTTLIQTLLRAVTSIISIFAGEVVLLEAVRRFADGSKVFRDDHAGEQRCCGDLEYLLAGGVGQGQRVGDEDLLDRRALDQLHGVVGEESV